MVSRATWTAVRNSIKTKKLKKLNQTKPKLIELKIRPKWTALGLKKEYHKTKSIRTLAKLNPMFIVV
jgi:hypothetical protein